MVPAFHNGDDVDYTLLNQFLLLWLSFVGGCKLACSTVVDPCNWVFLVHTGSECCNTLMNNVEVIIISF